MSEKRGWTLFEVVHISYLTFRVSGTFRGFIDALHCHFDHFISNGGRRAKAMTMIAAGALKFLPLNTSKRPSICFNPTNEG